MKKQTIKTERPSPYGVRLSNKHRKLLKTKAKKDGVSMHAYCLTHLTILAES